MTDTSNSSLRNFRIVLWALVVVVAIGATALYLLRPPTRPLAVTGTPFALTATTGETFTQEDLRGEPSLVFFGFTNCPDVCPTTLAETTMWKEALNVTAEDLRVIFVTVDPERDDLETVRGYLAGWDPSIIGLVGDAQQTEAAKAAFGVFSEKAGEGEYYSVNHTASVFLVGADGTFEGTIGYEEPTETALGKIRRLVGG